MANEIQISSPKGPASVPLIFPVVAKVLDVIGGRTILSVVAKVAVGNGRIVVSKLCNKNPRVLHVNGVTAYNWGAGFDFRWYNANSIARRRMEVTIEAYDIAQPTVGQQPVYSFGVNLLLTHTRSAQNKSTESSALAEVLTRGNDLKSGVASERLPFKWLALPVIDPELPIPHQDIMGSNLSELFCCGTWEDGDTISEFQVFDVNDVLKGSGDAYPDSIDHTWWAVIYDIENMLPVASYPRPVEAFLISYPTPCTPRVVTLV